MEKKKVLIADDDRTILLAGKTFLEGKGFQVITADNGQDALTQVKEELPDIILLDVVMPGKDGFEVCQEIKENDRMKNTKVVIFSGNVKEVEKGFDYGADDCIAKPLDWNRLAERIDVLTG